jgi:farnesyl-diphosphate farnesyltransferase
VTPSVPTERITARELLTQTSRTFALAVPLLPEPTQRAVCLAYLLFRVADTLEDASWNRQARQQALEAFCVLLHEPSTSQARATSLQWLTAKPTSHEGYLRLLAAFPELLAEVFQLEEGTRRIICSHVLRTAEGMHRTVGRSDGEGSFSLATLEELRSYCYTVAGIVGELLTALFLHHAPMLKKVELELTSHQAAFGEALQLVNILKDEREDLSQGRGYLPPGVPRAQLLSLAREDLRRARLYINALTRAHAPLGFVAFTSLPAELAEATLALVEREGPGAKVPRLHVLELLERYNRLRAESHAEVAIGK